MLPPTQVSAADVTGHKKRLDRSVELLQIAHIAERPGTWIKRMHAESLDLAVELPDLQEFELNPVIVHPQRPWREHRRRTRRRRRAARHWRLACAQPVDEPRRIRRIDCGRDSVAPSIPRE